MKPMNWLPLMIYFLLTYMILQTLIYFNFKKFSITFPLQKLIYKKFHPKW